MLTQISNLQFDDYYVAPASTATHCNGLNGSGASRNISNKLMKYYNSWIIASGGGTTPSIPNTAKPAFRYGGSFLQEAVQSFQEQDKAGGNPCDELRQYLESGPERTEDVIAWWGVC